MPVIRVILITAYILNETIIMNNLLPVNAILIIMDNSTGRQALNPSACDRLLHQHIEQAANERNRGGCLHFNNLE
ncbi:hypothetical protein BBD42_02060 [Paenibacillus sp. BIHB 4019]|uniref:Uncharacterized protein n=1 Tax=Paenibacillus sp. BIHB 4019 TaxID=1870819 RepID=A0A1B2DCF2_9BACL|nr:hypothetical protein BBD42_02060 [Paenibacillus sp. BIHB 4019]